MKTKTFFSLFSMMLITLSLSAQTSEIKSVIFCGVDFSAGKIYGASETPDQFRTMFHQVNDLFVSEPAKYNVPLFTGHKVLDYRLNAAKESNSNVSDDKMRTMDADYTLTDEQISEALQNLKLADSDTGTGLVLIMQILNKTSRVGKYRAVYFDIDTRRVIESYSVWGTAMGFGLRNFWARTVYDAMSQMQYYKPQQYQQQNQPQGSVTL